MTAVPVSDKMTAASSMGLTMLVIVKWRVLNRYRISRKDTTHITVFCYLSENFGLYDETYVIRTLQHGKTKFIREYNNAVTYYKVL
jgi:hypothetical protein